LSAVVVDAMAHDRAPARRRRRWLVVGLVGVLAVLALATALPWMLAGLARWLIVADPLDHAAAIVVLSGDVPFRAMEGAALYRRGWAPEVWLTRPANRAAEDALARLGIAAIHEEDYSRRVLIESGVPEPAIRVLDGPVVNTVDEVRAIARALARDGGDRVILVTSKPHTRRVRATWRALIGDSPRVIVRPATDDPFDAAHWWRHTGDVLAVSREIPALVNVWAGFPVRHDPAR
jgi:uncharacterized SAM-binding protein YcdF (DUF218 family)